MAARPLQHVAAQPRAASQRGSIPGRELTVEAMLARVAVVGWRGELSESASRDEASVKAYAVDSRAMLCPSAMMLAGKRLLFQAALRPYTEGAYQEGGEVYEVDTAQGALLLTAWVNQRLVAFARVDWPHEATLQGDLLALQTDALHAILGENAAWRWVDLRSATKKGICAETAIKIGVALGPMKVEAAGCPQPPLTPDRGRRGAAPAPPPHPPPRRATTSRSSGEILPPFEVSITARSRTRLGLWHGAGVNRREFAFVEPKGSLETRILCGGAPRGAAMRLDAGSATLNVRLVGARLGGFGTGYPWATRPYEVGDRKSASSSWLKVTCRVLNHACRGWVLVLFGVSANQARVRVPRRLWAVLLSEDGPTLCFFERPDAIRIVAAAQIADAEVSCVKASAEDDDEDPHEALLIQPTKGQNILIDRDRATPGRDWASWKAALKTVTETSLPSPMPGKLDKEGEEGEGHPGGGDSDH